MMWSTAVVDSTSDSVRAVQLEVTDVAPFVHLHHSQTIPALLNSEQICSACTAPQFIGHSSLLVFETIDVMIRHQFGLAQAAVQKQLAI